MTSLAPPDIRLEAVRVHNLQSIDLSLPLRRLIVITGVSGSGKSSLAFDTLFAEGQRRYIETFSTYARQFLDRLAKPDADRIENIPPAIAVRQHSSADGGKSTVATATEIHDFLRLLYSRIGKIVCPGCGRTIRRDTADDALRLIGGFAEGSRFQVGFPMAADGDVNETRAGLVEAGFTRAICGGKTCDLTSGERAEFPVGAELWVIVDRLVAGSGKRERVVDSIETAFKQGAGRGLLLEASDDAKPQLNGLRVTVDERAWFVHRLNRELVCEPCGKEFLEPEPRLFSFNSPLGACVACQGFGLDAGHDVCPACGGDRLQPAALAVRVNDCNIAELCRRSLQDVIEYFAKLPDALSPVERETSRSIVAEAGARLQYLAEAGLHYLSLDRPVRTLSGGEARRVSLTAALGSSLVNTLYVLDEPSAGLHPRDSERVISAVKRLRDAGNTVVVVEHDEAFVRVAEQLVDIGPGAGREGGRVVFQGVPADVTSAEESVTGAYLAGRRSIKAPAPEKRRKVTDARIRLEGVCHHNLENLSVEFPLGLLCVVTGVSGSGKSSLVRETLYPALCRELGQACEVERPGAFRHISGQGDIDEVVLVDAAPMGRTRRSTPVTYLKAFGVIRSVFASTREARVRNFGPTTFSFNSARGGRCPGCRGSGSVDIDMQFLADISMTCAECGGRRYRRDVLDVKYRGRNIADVLDMTVREAFTFFRTQPKLLKKLRYLSEVGLDYLPLGQPATTLSGGELQRLKLATWLAEGAKSRTLFLIDEPTTGLHAADVERLLECFTGLLAVGHSLIVVEHHLDVIRSADYVIDLGPEAGTAGGRVVVEGTPEDVAGHAQSITGEYLRRAGVVPA